MDESVHRNGLGGVDGLWGRLDLKSTTRRKSSAAGLVDGLFIVD